MSSKKRDLDYYMKLNYEIILKKIDKYEEVFYQAYTRELDPVAFYGVGDTPVEAIKSFEYTKEEMFKDYLAEGLEIPEPELEEVEKYSGKFVVRTTPKIHRDLIREAKKQKLSLNSLINSIFTSHLTSSGLLAMAERVLERAIGKHLEQNIFGRQDYEPLLVDWTSKTHDKKKAEAA